MKAEEFDKKFDDGEEDITGLLDLSKARRLGVPRQALIKMIVSSPLPLNYFIFSSLA